MTITIETWISVGLTLFSTAVGGGLTWLAAHRYYVRAAKDMEAESQKLRDLQRLSLYAMENAGMVELNRNAQGDITGMKADMSINMVGTSSMSADLSRVDEVDESHHRD